MRALNHEVKLEGGRLLLPLTMSAIRALSTVPANPVNLAEGCVDPGKVVTARQDLGLVSILDAFHAAAGKDSPGVEAIALMAKPKDLQLAFAMYCAAIIMSMGPERPQEATSPKA